jgi:hypothetical protein
MAADGSQTAGVAICIAGKHIGDVYWPGITQPVRRRIACTAENTDGAVGATAGTLADGGERSTTGKFIGQTLGQSVQGVLRKPHRQTPSTDAVSG